MLKVTLKDWKKWTGQGETLALFIFQEQIPERAKADGFKGKESESFLHRTEKSLPAERVLLIGLGKKSEFSNETLRRAAAKVLRGAESLGLERISLRAPKAARSPAAQADELQALAEGLFMSMYRFARHN